MYYETKLSLAYICSTIMTNARYFILKIYNFRTNVMKIIFTLQNVIKNIAVYEHIQGVP